MEVLRVAAMEALRLDLCRENSKARNRSPSAKELVKIWRVGFPDLQGNWEFNWREREGEIPRGKELGDSLGFDW